MGKKSYLEALRKKHKSLMKKRYKEFKKEAKRSKKKRPKLKRFAKEKEIKEVKKLAREWTGEGKKKLPPILQKPTLWG